MSDGPRKISRRDFMKATGLGGSALVLGVPFLFDDELGTDEAIFQPNAYISIGDDGVVTLTVHRSDMGQGVRTSCAMLLADELAVDWDDIVVQQAIGHPRFGNQNTDGSRSIRNFFIPLRRAGAAGREMLIAAAAEEWGVAAEDCYAESGQVVHRTSGDRLDYASLVARASKLPVPEEPRLKGRDEFTIIGKPVSGIDVDEVTTGKARYGWDVVIPNMLYASLERTPNVKGSIAGYDKEAALAVPGVRDVVELEADSSGLTNASIAVVADNTWAAFRGRSALNPSWDRGPLPPENSEDYARRLKEIAGSPGRVIRSEGDFPAAEQAAERVIEATYTGPYLVHAPMEPPACTAWVHGDRCEVWAPTQAPQWARGMIANELGIPEENVTVHVTLLGGGFGRKSKPDFIMESIQLSRKIGAPVKVAWKREDEVRHGFYRAQNCQKIRATIDADGNVSGWQHRTVFPSIGWRFDTNQLAISSGELAQGFTNIPYRFPALQLEAGEIASSQRIGWWRSVCHTFHAFAVNGFMDELAHATGRDPVSFHLDMLGEPRVLELSDRDREARWKFDTGRLMGVIEQVRRMSNWDRRDLPDRHGMGFAVHYSFYTYVAMAMRVSVNENGDLTVHEVDAAVDCGQVVNPDTVEAQVSGAVGFALSAVLYDEITVKDGVVQQGNFDNYPMLRAPEMPKVNVHIVDSREAPTGIGEPGVPPVAPALTNAIYAATGVRIRDLPLAGKSLG